MNYQQDCPHYMHKLPFNFFNINIKYWVVRFKYFNKAVSKVGAQGVMQLMPTTAKQLGVGNSFSARQNIKGGINYLKKMYVQFVGNIKKT